MTGTSNVGGLVGSTWGDITRSYATGAVSGVSEVGGLVGYNGGYITEFVRDGAGEWHGQCRGTGRQQRQRRH